ncbi:hypothetical protein OV203_01440 [Nannocystis sp. ILAH1]|uniref:hypothetical protein n=1 Tax=Nannocystis sp. ILAH1 TaxID=2996789 RepID=UPI00226D7E69|nr:hypothetical protein [Nannocystis sp. ILAH1]MCY0985774.1 hypothetical protein [Nannocystis sp. ILAH1]
MAATSRKHLFATELYAPEPTVRFSFEGDTTALVDSGSLARSSYTVTWSGKPFAQVWLAARPAFAPTHDVFLGYHPIETATATLAAQFIADALQREVTVEGRVVTPRPLSAFLSRRLFLTEKDFKKSIAALEELQK